MSPVCAHKNLKKSIRGGRWLQCQTCYCMTEDMITYIDVRDYSVDDRVCNHYRIEFDHSMNVGRCALCGLVTRDGETFIAEDAPSEVAKSVAKKKQPYLIKGLERFRIMTNKGTMLNTWIAFNEHQALERYLVKYPKMVRMKPRATKM